MNRAQFLIQYLNIAKNFLKALKVRFAALVMAGEIVLAIFAAAGVDYVLANQVDGLVSSLAEKRSLLKVWIERDNTVIQLRRDYGAVKNVIPKIDRPLPNVETFGVFIADVENTAAASGVSQTLSFQEPQPFQIENVLVVPFSITLSGATYGSVLDYVKKFENLPYFVEIETFGFSSSAGIFTPGQASLTARVFIKK